MPPGGRRSWRGEVSSSPSRRASSAAPPPCRRCLPARDLSSGAPPGPLSGCRNRGHTCKTRQHFHSQKKHEDGGSSEMFSGSEEPKTMLMKGCSFFKTLDLLSNKESTNMPREI